MPAQPLLDDTFLRAQWSEEFDAFQAGAESAALLAHLRAWAERDPLNERASETAFIQRFFHKHIKGAGWLRSRQLALLRNCRRCRDKILIQFQPRRWHSLQHGYDTLVHFKIRTAPGSRRRCWR